MSDDFYTEMQGVATELLSEFKTGVARLVRRARTAADAQRPYDKADGAPAYTTLNGVVLTVDKKLVDNKRVFGREDMLVCAHPGFDIEGTDKVEIDGRERTIIKFKPKPGAGIRVCWFVVLED